MLIPTSILCAGTAGKTSNNPETIQAGSRDDREGGEVQRQNLTTDYTDPAMRDRFLDTNYTNSQTARTLRKLGRKTKSKIMIKILKETTKDTKAYGRKEAQNPQRTED